MKYIFIRNDDVRDILDSELIDVTKSCTRRGISICHTVEPGNLSKEVADWLKDEKNKQNSLIEVVQHGYDHSLNYEKVIGNKVKKGEFGGDLGYSEQLLKIKKGKKILDENFGCNWFPLFTFPFGGRNINTLNAIKDCGFKAVNGSLGVTLNHKILYFMGRILKREMLFGRKISYHLKYRKEFELFQIDTGISIIKKYINENDCTFYSLQELKDKTTQYLKKTNVLGIVLHHRFHKKENVGNLLEDYLDWLKTIKDVEFVTQEKIYNKYYLSRK